MQRFEGQHAVVTGAGSGFGAAIAKRFVSEGGRVTLADINEDGMARVAGELRDREMSIKAEL